jgi:hypothetical protein
VSTAIGASRGRPITVTAQRDGRTLPLGPSSHDQQERALGLGFRSSD